MGWLVVVARGLYLARHLFTLWIVPRLMEEATSSEIFCLFLSTGATQVQGPVCHACVHVGFNDEEAEQVG